MALLVVIVQLISSQCVDAKPRERPNIVFILADDLGYCDVGFMGSDFYETPNIDQLARRGIHFTNAYAAAPLCSATRCSIMTGQYPARTGLTGASGHLENVILEKQVSARARASVPYTAAISTSRMGTEHVTLAEALRSAGYTTAHFGKWHLGSEPFDPLHQGYDLDVPHTPAPSPLPNGFFYPFHVWKGKGKPGDNLEDLLVQDAAHFIERQAHVDTPFFLAYWAFQVHSPWQAKKEQIDRYRSKVEPNARQRNPVYAGMVETLDDAVGTLVQALTDSGKIDNTIIIFTSDNGGFDYNHTGPHMPDEFKQVPVTDNHPLRAGKATVYEGGVRVPTVVVWPHLTEAGQVSKELVSSIDWYPTFQDLLDLPGPNHQLFDGVSIAAALRGKELARDTVFCHFPHAPGVPDNLGPATTVRKGDWKLIRYYHTNPDQTDQLELYNLATDAGESKNLVEQHPDITASLNELIANFLTETKAAVPLPNPAYRPPRAPVSTNARQLGGPERMFVRPAVEARIFCSITSGEEGNWDVPFDPALPNVLIIGDSISMAYTPYVRSLLQTKANVARAVRAGSKRPVNCGSTVVGLEAVDKWLGDQKWDVIHFNWGLHDLCYRHPDSKVQGNRDKVHGTIAVPLADYEKNLDKLVQRLKKTGATLVWANTTTVPQGEAGRFVGDDEKYNAVAARIMKKYNIRINDLNALTRGFSADHWTAPGNVHFKPRGSQALAKKVAEAINQAIEANTVPSHQ